ncbi:hypothetical protein [Chitiniphilus eburneus]|uniref:ribbon-helix-helix domain-containing protein n=1 Tax=Chitiniphilus eburneus TaxID=2571148 RepID=UPI0035CEC9ED
MTNVHPIVSRSPRGSGLGKNISLRLRPDERELVDQLAQQEERSVANMARTLVLEALRARNVTLPTVPEVGE